MPERLFDVQSLYGPGAQGNRHTLVYTKNAAALEDLSPELRDAPNLIRLSGSPEHLRGHFSHRGQPVLRCGSGNMAIAEAARQMFGVPEQGGWNLQTDAGTVWLGYDVQGPYYRDKPLRQHTVPKPQLWRHLLDGTFDTGSYAGGHGDYALLALSQPLKKVQPALRRLCQYSRRALILVYRQGPGLAQLRYFAPQYGTAEDAATGSASVQAAHFLWNLYRESRFTFLQASPQGGYIQTETRGGDVVVRGRAKLNPCSRGQ
ncbi:PhzF family phenazine biosynthesis protein [Marinimicrobium sp. ABcell2]|uniref:PhzF family phenazine biosynthesis protein n=1 Tax=Marinimicrobium sp. ABcell2 TaxID=3069751 RepID=UPI0027B2DC10|nr:PhzF family phenazine biosynthesis protein [Marinimicrobium sp. ABcell2]MDQ2078224.1 PhzF family phenazine biosynthesis protein [Marinimicrobium sp. ABcell2]